MSQIPTITNDNNRTEESKILSELERNDGNEWNKLQKYVDFKKVSAGKDVSRMRKIMIDLKNTK